MDVKETVIYEIKNVGGYSAGPGHCLYNNLYRLYSHIGCHVNAMSSSMPMWQATSAYDGEQWDHF